MRVNDQHSEWGVEFWDITLIESNNRIHGRDVIVAAIIYGICHYYYNY